MKLRAWLYAIAMLGAFIAGPVLPVEIPECLHGLVRLADRAPKAFAGQRKATHRVADDRRVEEYHATSHEPEDLHPRVVQGLLTANCRFVQTRGEDIAPDHVFQKQKNVDPVNTSYFILGAPKERREALGLGMLIDGTTGRPVPIETELPGLDLRHRHGKPIQVMEVARLGIAESEKGGLRLVFAGMAKHLARRYGGATGVPPDLHIVLWTSKEGLVERYRDAYGFAEWENPDSEHWVMGMSASDFMTRYFK